MRNHGNKLIVGLLFWIAIFSISSAQSYYLCAYETHWGGNINVKKVDLSTKSITQIGSFPLGGDIEFRTPLVLYRGNSTYLFISAISGWGGKNSEMSNNMGTNYVVIDTTGNLIKAGTFGGYHLYGFLGYDLNRPVIKYSYDDGNLRNKMRGLVYFLPHDSVSLQPLGEESQINIRPQLGPFVYYNKINYNNDRFRWAINNSALYLLSLDITNRSLLDSIRVSANMYYSYLFQLSVNDSLLYVFHINCNKIGGPEESQKHSIDPSYLIKYRTFDMAAIDSVFIPYPPLDSGYVICERGSCDRIGPFLVYYFFNDEDIGYFSPAMLFIFDTRTNQATWLRVGWR